MAEQSTQKVGDKGIGEGNLSREPGAPPYADKAYAGEGEGEPGAVANTGAGANVSQQGGGLGSDKQAGNTQSSGAEG